MKKLLSTGCALIGATLLAVLSGPAYADGECSCSTARRITQTISLLCSTARNCL